MILEVLVKVKYDSDTDSGFIVDPYTDEQIASLYDYETILAKMCIDHFETKQLIKNNPEL